VRRLKATTHTEEISAENKLGINLLRGIASKVTTQGKGILKSMLPGAEKVYLVRKFLI